MMTPLLAMAIRSSIMLAAGLLLSACLVRRSAALRHGVLAATLAAAAIVTPLSLVLPAWTVTVPSLAAQAEVTTIGTTPAVLPTPPAALEHTTSPPSISFVVIGWLAGVLACLGMLTAGVMRIRRLAACAVRVDDAQWTQMLDSLAAHYRLTREIVIARTDSPHLLATWGAVRPHILLPNHATGWTTERVRIVLAHELAHVRRHDWLVQIGAEALRAVLWFNPLAWLVCARLGREREQACDDEVLRLGVEPGNYAALLLDIARACRWHASASAMPMAHRSTLERRISAMLDPQVNRHAPSRRSMASLAVVLLVVMLPVAAVRARQSGPAPLSGTVYDVTGAVLPGVTLTLTDSGQNTVAAASNAGGQFTFPSVAAGRYVLDATLPGFRSLRHEFELRDTADWNRAVTLQVSELKETVRIRASRTTAATTPAQTAAGPVRVGGNLRAPRKIKDVRPIYPEAMQAAGLTGVVPIDAVIGVDGTVTLVRVLSAQVHPDFAIAAIDAVRQWRFTPTLLNGVAVDVVMTVTVRFDLEN